MRGQPVYKLLGSANVRQSVVVSTRPVHAVLPNTSSEPDIVESEAVVEHALSILADHAGVLRSRHGDRLAVLYPQGGAPA